MADRISVAEWGMRNVLAPADRLTIETRAMLYGCDAFRECEFVGLAPRYPRGMVWIDEASDISRDAWRRMVESGARPT